MGREKGTGVSNITLARYGNKSDLGGEGQKGIPNESEISSWGKSFSWGDCKVAINTEEKYAGKMRKFGFTKFEEGHYPGEAGTGC